MGTDDSTELGDSSPGKQGFATSETLTLGFYGEKSHPLVARDKTTWEWCEAFHIPQPEIKDAVWNSFQGLVNREPRPMAWVKHSENFPSVTMTTCSTVAALGMMPLCLYLYTWSWTPTQNLAIPYQNIGITLVSLIVPVAAGVCVNHRWPKQAKVILKVGAVAAGILLLVVAVTSVVLAKGWGVHDVTLIVISFIFPLVGHVMGFLLAFFTHQSWQRCRTISIETGAQNVQLCIAMLQLSFTAEHLGQLLNFAFAFGLFQVLHGLLIVAAYQAYKRWQKSRHRRQHPERPDVCGRRKPRETSAFLEEGDEATGAGEARAAPQG